LNTLPPAQVVLPVFFIVTVTDFVCPTLILVGIVLAVTVADKEAEVATLEAVQVPEADPPLAPLQVHETKDPALGKLVLLEEPVVH
jgi:hypothetical protein